MDLKHPRSLDQGGTVAELSRPAHHFKRKIKDETRKPQGRKAIRTEKMTKNINWFTPFLFWQIDQARISAGGPK